MDSIRDGIDYLKNGKERKRNQEQMKNDLDGFWEDFYLLSGEDQKGIFDVAEFLLEDGGVINITMEDKEKEKKLKEMSDILVALPRKDFLVVYKTLKEKLDKQSQLSSVLNNNERPTEYEESDNEQYDEDEEHAGSGSEEIPQGKSI